MDTLFFKYFFSLYFGEKTKHISFLKQYDTDSILKKRGVLTADEVNKYIYIALCDTKPFFVGRLGGMEFSAIKDYIITSHLCTKPFIRKKVLSLLTNNAGFFPFSSDLAVRFSKLMLEAMQEADVQVNWWGGFENYLIERYTQESTCLTDLPSFEPWQIGVTIPWSAALKGKRVLIIHPFEETIRSQYQKRALIFPGTEILPEFELKTLKAVQTIAGQKDERFETWFEALDYMYEKAMSIDFDIAIIGCGAYGYPLAAKLKQAGKQAVHLGGATQILFGIKGKRWESEKNFGYLHPYINEYWIYPKDEDVPQNFEKIEGGCYWK